jgi:peroxiredoxin
VGRAVDDFRALDTEPFGINEADAASHQQFIDQLALPFDLLVDEDLSVARTYGTLRPDGDRNARTVIIVGKDGKIVLRAAGAPPPAELLDAIQQAADQP